MIDIIISGIFGFILVYAWLELLNHDYTFSIPFSVYYLLAFNTLVYFAIILFFLIEVVLES